MNQMTSEFLQKARKAFADNAGISLQDVRTAVASLPASIRRRDTLSALDAVRKLFGRDLGTVSADWRTLRALFQSQNAAQLGVSEKRLANIRSEVTKAVKSFGVGQPAITKRMRHAPEWTELLARVPFKSYGHALNRLASFCSIMGISPERIDAAVLLAFHEALVAEEVIKHPRKILKFTTAHWNICRRRVAGWPDTRLVSPFPSSRYRFDLNEFPAAFQADVRRWRQRLLEPDPMGDDGPDVALRLITVNSQEKRLLRFATALVKRGHKKLEEITSLGVLLQIETFKEGLRFFIERTSDRQASEYIRKTGWLLLSIARHHAKLPPAHAEAMKKVLARLGRREPGMTKKNQQRLAQFDNEANVVKLLNFPEEERKRGLKIKNPYRRAKAFERALSAAILIYASVRMQNLRTIRMDKNIRRHRGVLILSFEETETKNKKSLELELPQGVANLLQEFVEQYRPALPGSQGPYLFPGRDGGPRSANTMSHDFNGALLKHTGLRVNPHLMRHATAMLAINQDPANLAIVAQRMGHRIETTRQYYLGNESRPSSRVMNRILEEAAKKPLKAKRK
jgi:integrase